MSAALPLLLEADTLAQHLDDPALLIVDLRSESSYRQGHIPGAVHIETAELIRGEKPAPGLLPPLPQLEQLFSRLGLTPDTQVVCYDDEGGAWSGRFLWTLEVIGHHRYSFLNGGIQHWRTLRLPEDTRVRQRRSSNVRLVMNSAAIATAEDILQLLGNPDVLIWDARSAEEYRGEKVLAEKGGHIPGAVHCEWTSLLDPADDLRLRRDLDSFLKQRGITPDKQIITHCQTHRRSGLTWLAAKVLGYPHVRAYPGSWSEWGNRSDTPVEK